MSTMGALVDRMFRDFLSAADDQPARITLADAVEVADTVISYSPMLLAADELDVLAEGVLIEVDREHMIVTGIDDGQSEFTVVRGANGTTATTHAAGDFIGIAPTFSRQTVWDALADNIVGLYPALWRVATEEVTVGESWTEAPAEMVTPTDFMYLSGGSFRQAHVATLDNFTQSSTGKAVVLPGVPVGATGWLTFRGKFPRPTDEDTDLSTLGIETEWERIVMIGALAQILAGTPEVSAVTQEFITEQMRVEAFPPGTSGRIADRLLRYHEFLLEKAQEALFARYPTPVMWNEV